MKIICTKENFKKGLFAVSRVVGVGNPLQVLNNILIKTDQGRIRFSSTNLEIGVNTWIGGKIEEEGSITVPARLINEYVNNLPTEKVTISSKDSVLNIESENYQTTINGLPADDFPLIPEVSESMFTSVEEGELKEALSETVWAAATNETQPEISGIFMSFEDSVLKIAATDRYRLAERKINLDEPAKTAKQVIIPARTITELYKLLEVGKKKVEIYFSESQVLFRLDGTEIISRLIDGQYPDYQQIIPREFKTEARVSKDDLTHALKAAALFSSDSNNVELKTDKNQIIVTASSAQAGENTTKISAKVSGEEKTAIFNFRYLLDCLNNLPEKNVILKLISDSSPAALFPEGREDYLYIVMPVKV